jgi:type II secretory pathway component PulK
MERKWDINLVVTPRNVQKEILQKALAEVGVTDSEQSSTIIDSIVDWMSSGNGNSGFNGAGNDYYTRLNPPYYCKNGPIDDITELLLVKGVTPEIFWGSNSSNHIVSPFQQHGGGGFNQPTANQTGAGFHDSDQPQYPVGLYDLFSAMGGPLNINTASIKTLQLIPGIDEATAEHIIQQRAGPDGEDGTDDDVPMQSPGDISGDNVPGGPQAGVQAGNIANYVGVRSYVFDVKVDASINDYHRIFHGVIARGGGGGQQFDCKVFYWE